MNPDCGLKYCNASRQFPCHNRARRSSNGQFYILLTLCTNLYSSLVNHFSQRSPIRQCTAEHHPERNFNLSSYRWIAQIKKNFFFLLRTAKQQGNRTQWLNRQNTCLQWEGHAFKHTDACDTKLTFTDAFFVLSVLAIALNET